MGYRRLLKSYLKHVEQLIGTSLVELSSASELFTKRDVGELNVLAAELAREQFRNRPTQDKPPDHGALLAAAIRSLNLSVEQAAAITALDVKTINRWCYTEADQEGSAPTLCAEEFSRVLFALLSWHAAQPLDAEAEEKLRSPPISAAD